MSAPDRAVRATSAPTGSAPAPAGSSPAEPAPAAPVLSVRGLTVGFGTRTIVRGVDLDLHAGEVLGIVGPSGSGKSVLSRALIGLAGDGARVTADRFEVRVDDRVIDLARAGGRRWREVRGATIGLVLQDALVALDPLRTVGRELDEAMGPPRVVGGRRESRDDRRARAVSLLERAGLSDAASFLDRRTDQLSGGQRQRALIATALARDPRILIADEPTASLDPATRDGVLRLFDELALDGLAIVLVSHDLPAIERVATTVCSLTAGRLHEADSFGELDDPELFPMRPLALATSDGRPPVLSMRGASKSFAGADGRRIDAVVSADLDLAPRETVGIVGASGSGKTTLARLVLGLEAPDAGSIEVLGEPWPTGGVGSGRPRHPLVGVVPQDPLSSFNPRHTVGRIIADALAIGARAGARGGHRPHAVASALDEVGLGFEVVDARPLRLSGGQRQRVAIARALAAGPRVLVCDEAVSALDPATRDRILELLERVRDRHGLAMLFISHDPLVTARMSHRILRMTDGRLAPDD